MKLLYITHNLEFCAKKEHTAAAGGKVSDSSEMMEESESQVPQPPDVDNNMKRVIMLTNHLTVNLICCELVRDVKLTHFTTNTNYSSEDATYIQLLHVSSASW